MASTKLLNCPLCHGGSVDGYHSDALRDYYQCNQCQLVFVPPWQHLSQEQEKAHYDLHQNSPADHRYRQFLSRLADPLIAGLEPGAQGLDFGSGPGPTLSVILEEAGFSMAVFDIFYANDTAVLQPEYDFITATEVVEHLSQPGEVLDSLWSGIKTGGYLGLMTKLVVNKEAFSRWHYKNDQTHVCFFSRETFDYWCQSWGVEAEYPANDVILIRKIDGLCA